MSMIDIYRFIPRDRYITREELVRRTGYSDRMIRREINELRKRPETVIVSSSHGKGYKRPSCREELLMCLNESKSRVREELEKQRVLEKAISIIEQYEKDGQLLFDF